MTTLSASFTNLLDPLKLDKTSGTYSNVEYLLLGIALAANLSGLWTTLQEPDAALYASISRTMVEKNDFINLYSVGKDWLDKPHLPFWIAALSFKIFGISTAAYKVPAILCLFLGARFTFLLGSDLGGRKTGFLAAFMLLCCQHILLSNTDVRAEPYLTAFMVGSALYFRRYFTHGKELPERSRFAAFFLGCLFAACAIMTKGIFTVLILAAGFATEFTLSRNWKSFFSPLWIAAAFLIALLISPEIYCLYSQFDLHPDKIIYGRTGVSGVRFFFWDSQFGRFNNSGPIKGKGDIFFYLHTLLWAFLPWSLVLVIAIKHLTKLGRMLTAARAKQNGSLICGSIAFFAVALFSLSHFQLPHYTNIIFPFLVIVCAHLLSNQLEPGHQNRKLTVYVLRSQQFVTAGLLITILLVIYIIEVPRHFLGLELLILCLYGSLTIFIHRQYRWSRSPQDVLKWCYYSGLTSLFSGITLSTIVFPLIVSYQAGSQAALAMNKKFPNVPFTQDGFYSYSLAFYAGASEQFYDPKSVSLMDSARIQRRHLVLSNKPKLPNSSAPPVDSFFDYHTTKLSLSFLFANTRRSTLIKRYLFLTSR